MDSICQQTKKCETYKTTLVVFHSHGPMIPLIPFLSTFFWQSEEKFVKYNQKVKQISQIL